MRGEAGPIKFFANYSGWDSGQLEREIAEGNILQAEGRFDTQLSFGVDTNQFGKYTNQQIGAGATQNLAELRTIQDWIIRRQLLGTPGVADVASFGGELKQYEMAIDLPPAKYPFLRYFIGDIRDAGGLRADLSIPDAADTVGSEEREGCGQRSRADARDDVELRSSGVPPARERAGAERAQLRTAQSFCVPKADIAAAGYDLSLLVRGTVPGGTVAASDIRYAAARASDPRMVYHGRVIRNAGWTITRDSFSPEKPRGIPRRSVR